MSHQSDLIASDIESYAEAQRIFTTLGEGGMVTWPWGPVFWAPGFGMVKDRFGVQWIITALSPP